MPSEPPGTPLPRSAGMIRWIEDRVRDLKRELHALCLACGDARTPVLARWLAVAVVAYAASPFDLIPDAIPVLGYLDDVILLPLGIALVLKLIPAAVMDDCRTRAKTESFAVSPRWKWLGGAFVAAAWAAVAIWIVWLWTGMDATSRLSSRP